MYIYLTHRCALRPTPLFLQRTFSTFHPASPPASQHIAFVLIRLREFGTLVVWGMLERQQKHINIAELKSLRKIVVVRSDPIVISAIIDAYIRFQCSLKQVAT
jgi:hypothetical protein